MNIVFCTLRDNKGATGGPAGVLYLQKKVLGKKILNCNCDYWFNTFKSDKVTNKILNKIVFFIKCFITWKSYFFVHDITSGWILSLLGRKYSLVYHSQGPSLEESINLGVRHNFFTSCFLRYRERMAFIHAKSLHFPSMGAADLYFSSKYASCNREEINLERPLYNIIIPNNPNKPEHFPLEKDKDILTFFSLGTLTVAKGQDQTIEFLADFLKYYDKPTRYILVGKGPLKKELINKLEMIKSEIHTFSYYYFEALPHDSVMYLHQISDVYIMLHRISIFDFATLEAMSQESAVILSKVGGNPEFNIENNIIFSEDVLPNMSSFADTNFIQLKQKNKEVFDKYFSDVAFKKQYELFFSRLLNS